MTVLLVVVMFAVILLIDHLFASKAPAHAQSPVEVPQVSPITEPRLLPSVVGGFQLMDNLRYHPGHTWAAGETAAMVRVGIDDFAARIAGRINSLTLPARGQWVRQGQRIATITREGKSADLFSPVEGTVVEVNENVLANANVATDDPYGDGWLITVHSPDWKTNMRNLLSGTTARRWMEDAAARLRSMMPAPALVTAQDGGLAVKDLTAELKDTDWEKITHEFFLN